MTQTTTTVSAGVPARMQKSMDREGDAAPRTTAISADVPAQTQHITKGRSLWIEEPTRLHDVSTGMPARTQKSMDRGSDAAPQCSLVGRRLPFLAEHDDLADRCVVLAARRPPDFNLNCFYYWKQ